MSKQDDNKAVVGRWFTEFWGKSMNLAVVDEIAAPDMLLKYSLHAPRRGRGDAGDRPPAVELLDARRAAGAGDDGDRRRVVERDAHARPRPRRPPPPAREDRGRAVGLEARDGGIVGAQQR